MATHRVLGAHPQHRRPPANHGFLRDTTAGWSLAPAFDLNPDPRPGPKLLSTAIDERSREARVDTVMDVAEYFRMREPDARRVLGEVVAATEQWRRVAAEGGLEEAAIGQMARAFEHAESERAREILAGVRSTARRARRLG